MIRVIDKSNIHLFHDTMEQHFRLRHQVFVQENGWKEFEHDGVYEKDQYDNEHATYAVSLDDTGKAIGCFRIYPTMLPHMLSETFPNMIDGAVIRRSDVYEITRFHLDKATRNSAPFLELLTAIQEVGIELGLSGFTAISRTLRIPIIQSSGLSLEPLGQPALMDGISNVAVFIETSERRLASVRKTSGQTASVLEHNQIGYRLPAASIARAN